MLMRLQESVRLRLSEWLDEHGGDQKSQTIALSDAYRQGAASSKVSLVAYVTTRMPATFAAVAAVLEQVQIVAPLFAPRTVFDVGAGPGTASFAAMSAWPTVTDITMVETDKRFAALAAELSPHAKILHQSFLQTQNPAELVIAAYVFAELPLAQMASAAFHLWAQTQGLLAIIEPGTPQGFARIRAARAALITRGANVIGPCTHANVCPMQGTDWCHFKTRLARSRAHMQAKSAVVPFEDESYAWIAVARQPHPLAHARILAPPNVNKVAVTLKLCSAAGLTQSIIASRSKPAYKRAKKLRWGDTFDG